MNSIRVGRRSIVQGVEKELSWLRTRRATGKQDTTVGSVS